MNRCSSPPGSARDRGADDTTGQFSYQHVFSPEIIADVRGMASDLTATLWSNPFSTPIYAAQDRGMREEYIKATTSIHHGRQEWKAGIGAERRSEQNRVAEMRGTRS